MTTSWKRLRPLIHVELKVWNNLLSPISNHLTDNRVELDNKVFSFPFTKHVSKCLFRISEGCQEFSGDQLLGQFPQNLSFSSSMDSRHFVFRNLGFPADQLSRTRHTIVQFLNPIAGFHMTSLKFKLQNYWSSWYFIVVMYNSNWKLLFIQNFAPNGFLVLW